MRALIVTTFVLIVQYSFAQVRSDSTDRSLREQATKSSNSFKDRFTYSVNIFTSNWTSLPTDIKVKPFSPGYSVYMQYKAPLLKPYITFLIGTGVAYTDYRFNGKVFYTESLDSTYFLAMADTDYKRNKMSLVFVDLPLELRFSTRERKSGNAWYIAPGFSAGLLINDFIKTTSEDQNGNATKVKTYYTKNLNDYRYGATLRLGYGQFGLYGYYGLSELFESGKGFGTNFYHAGITLGGF